MAGEAEPEAGLERRAYARVGLLGNPSDVYGGRVLSFAIADFSATVRLRPSPQLLIQPHPHHDLVAFPSLPGLVSRLQNEGYYGGVRLLMAICKVFYNHCIQNNISLKAENFTLSYDTNIPRQVTNSNSLPFFASFTPIAYWPLFCCVIARERISLSLKTGDMKRFSNIFLKCCRLVVFITFS
ncbi:hypothetical protein U9M48_004710 [Paspalum notatum var. saurae]|uniref:Uncharacterized protein n=1 Tax=Paspalum notatum var. saurae TaxID=547442 RepID=A0AAQ3PKD9_PASNO